MALSRKPIEIVEEGKHQLLIKAPHWERVLLSHVAKVQNGFAFESELFSTSGGIPLIRIRDINSESTQNFYVGKRLDEYIVKRGDILIGMDGDFNSAEWKGQDGLLNQRVCRIFLQSQSFDRKFLFICLQPFLSAINAETSSVTVKHLSSKTVAEIPLPLPPLAEQKRIVSKIEELFSELDNGVESIRTAQQQLKIYRQALLKNAFEGNLTSDWRLQNSDKIESPDALLTRIQHEREARYQHQLQEWAEAQKVRESADKTDRVQARPRAPKNLPALSAADLLQLPKLPESWKWVQVGEAFGVYVGSTPSRGNLNYWGGEIPWVSSGEVAFCRIKGTKEKITESGYLNASTEIHPRGTVMLAMIGEGKTRGQAAILDVPAAHNQNTAAIRVSEAGCIPEFMYFYLCFQYEMTRKLGSGNNQKALNKERVSAMRMPFCSLAEQIVLVQLLEEKLSVVEQLEKTISDSLQQANALRQSILRKAFSGKLVAQNVEDESASALLERIRAESAVQSAISRPNKAKASA